MAQSVLPKAAVDALAYEEKTLPGGLTLRVKTMPEYDAVHAIYGTRFGSINQGFVANGQKVWLPAGTAHFLEHKMFENKNGQDAFELYAVTGAAANAYTSFDRTCYIFTATSEIDKNLDILLSFVSEPYFTEATVEKEQGIIGQEIKMYQDYADNRLLFALLASLYTAHPMREEIVGSVESIAEITPEILYACTDAFYNPGNMVLAAAGNITMQQLEAACERAGLTQAQPVQQPERFFPQESAAVACKEYRFAMPVAMPQFGIGFKEAPVSGTITDILHTELICDLLAELICGETSPLYRRLYDEGLVQPNFSGDAGSYEGALFFLFTGESEQPERVRELLLEEIARLRRDGVDAAQFESCKRMLYGETITELDSVERMASMLASCFFRERTPVQELEAIAALTVQDINAALQTLLLEENSAFVVVERQQ